MIKNNLIALFAHCSLNLFSAILVFGLIKEPNKTIAIANFLICLILYVLTGKFLKAQKSPFKNFISVSSITVIGFLIWLFSLGNYNSSEGDPFRGLYLFFHIFYNFFSYLLVNLLFNLLEESESFSSLGNAAILFLPSLILTIVLTLKDYKKSDHVK